MLVILIKFRFIEQFLEMHNAKCTMHNYCVGRADDYVGASIARQRAVNDRPYESIFTLFVTERYNGRNVLIRVSNELSAATRR